MRQFGVIWGLGSVKTFHAVCGPAVAEAATHKSMTPDQSISGRTNSIRIDSFKEPRLLGTNLASLGQKRGEVWGFQEV